MTLCGLGQSVEDGVKLSVERLNPRRLGGAGRKR